jgi:hypothetical protein
MGGTGSGSDNPCLEARAVHGEHEESLERQKLRAEVDEIRLRIREQSPGKWQRWSKAVLAYCAILIPLGIGVGGFLQGWSAYQAQRERLARFEVGSEVIQLTKQLSETDDNNLQRMAALELAWFGRPAVLILYEQLMQSRKPQHWMVRDAILIALAEVARIEKDPSTVLQPMIQSTASFVDRELNSDSPKLLRIKDRLNALSAVADVLGKQTDSNSLLRKENVQMLCKLQVDINNKLPSLIDAVTRILSKLSIECK